MLARRDFLVAAVAIFATAGVVVLAQTAARPVMRSGVFNWSSLKAETRPTGERRQVFDSRTATLDRFECHITTLNPGEAPHAAHRHPEEEVMIVKEGTIEEVQNGVTNRVEPGGIIFCASNEWHGMKNLGTNRATYFVFKFFPPGLNTNRLDDPVPAAK
jgi:XRE family transcriptional regulator, regulator of sulfur utilization